MSTSAAPHTSQLILGTMGLGTSTDLGREREIALAAVQTAISVGITCIDLADIYSQGRSEQVFLDRSKPIHFNRSRTLAPPARG